MDTAIALAVLGVLTAWAAVFLAIRRWGPGPATRWVHCPTKQVPAKVVLEQREGDFGSLCVTDVLACSLFQDGAVTCGKECLRRL